MDKSVARDFCLAQHQSSFTQALGMETDTGHWLKLVQYDWTARPAGNASTQFNTAMFILEA